MTEKNRTPYQREMDQIHVPEAKAKETLQKMLAENRRLREEEAKKPAGKQLFSTGGGRRAGRIPRLVPVFALAGVAACVLLVIGLTSRSDKKQFSQVQLSDLPVQSLSHKSGEDPQHFEDAFGFPAETLFSGWTVLKEETEAVRKEEGTGYEAVLELSKEDRTLTASVYDDQPDLPAPPSEEQQIAGQTVRLIKDAETNKLTGVFQKNGLYIVVSGSMEEQEFLRLLEQLIGS